MSGAPIKNNEVVFIDDSMENVESAAKIGIHALHFSTSEKLQADLRALLKTDIKAIQRESRIDAQKKRVT
jgi:FMN phosphatase YigB (HAD superfamily)